jgi:hypothetical protein
MDIPYGQNLKHVVLFLMEKFWYNSDRKEDEIVSEE